MLDSSPTQGGDPPDIPKKKRRKKAVYSSAKQIKRSRMRDDQRGKPRYGSMRYTAKSLETEFVKLPVFTESKGTRLAVPISDLHTSTTSINLDFEEIAVPLSRIEETQVRIEAFTKKCG